jgi:hypothetical protein
MNMCPHHPNVDLDPGSCAACSLLDQLTAERAKREEAERERNKLQAENERMRRDGVLSQYQLEILKACGYGDNLTAERAKREEAERRHADAESELSALIQPPAPTPK